MNELIWSWIARLVSSRAGFLLIAKHALRLADRGVRMPDIISGGDTYMRRFLVFNPYPEDNTKRWWGRWSPSVRLHHILLPDADRHLHDHPWAFRTIVLDGWYREERKHHHRILTKGSMGAMAPGEFHRIDSVSQGGVWTLFFTWKYQEQWGFDVDGKKVYSRDYFKNFSGPRAQPPDTRRR